MILRWFSHFATHTARSAMALTREQIASIAALARLDLTPAEIPVYQESLSKILDFVGALERADTAGVTPMAHPLPGLSQRLRPDVVTEKDRHEEYQRNAPQVAAGLYLVPKVIE
jgi:aspartyl-tRNA(Asn)/glutamyl-tRNA(Gln) amidotransferase subunit C